MKIDVIILCSGDAKFFATTLSSVLKQACPPTAIYVVDNACPHQKYFDIAKSIAGEAVHLVKFENRLRPTSNWQRALSVGNSPFFVTLHDDDVWEPDFLERARRCIDNNPASTAVLVGHAPFTDESGPSECQATKERTEKGLRLVDGLEEPLRTFVIATANTGHMSALVCRRGPFNFPLQNSWMPDQGFLATHAAYGRIAISSKVGVNIRMHGASGTSSFRGNSRSSFETLSHIRNYLMFEIENRGFKGSQLAELVDVLPEGYFYRVLQACFGWPLRKPLMAFGQDFLKTKALSKSKTGKSRVKKSLNQTGWILASIFADIKYFFREQTPKP